MIKLYFICLTFLLSSLSLHSQMVPNFVAQDINGNSHDLYSYLDEGKVVILDVFATWCTGCWINHKEEKLANLYKTYGPEGTDELVILFVEGDVATPDAALYNDNPFGDWTENVPFPILNPNDIDSTFLHAFACNGVPTTNVICPTTRENIADIFDFFLFEIIEVIQECNSISEVVDLQILGDREVSTPICLSTNLNFDVLNTGTEPVTNFTVSATEVGGVLINEFTYEGSLFPGQYTNVNLGDFSLPSVLDNQVVNLLIENEDAVNANNAQIVDYFRAPEVFNELTLFVKADFWAEEDNTRWWIENSAGEVVTPVNSLDPLTESEVSFFLENNDCFTFVIAEDFGDGLVLGEILLTDDQGNVLFDDENFGNRGEVSFEYVGFGVTSANTLDESEYQLNIHPNIVSDELQIQYTIPTQPSTLNIYTLQGQQLYSESLTQIDGSLSTSINVQEFSKGIYFVSIENEQGVLTRKFIKQ